MNFNHQNNKQKTLDKYAANVTFTPNCVLIMTDMGENFSKMNQNEN